MTRTHDRPRVQERDEAVAEQLIREAFRDVQQPQEPPTVQPPARTEVGTPGRPIRWMRWLALGAVLLIVGVGATVLLTRDSGTTTTTYSNPVRDIGNYRTADGWVRYFESQVQTPNVTLDFRTADGWERYFASLVQSPNVTHDYRTADGWARFFDRTTMGTLDFRTADGWDRVLQQFEPVMDDYRTADGWVRYFAYLDEARDAFIHL